MCSVEFSNWRTLTPSCSSSPSPTAWASSRWETTWRWWQRAREREAPPAKTYKNRSSFSSVTRSTFANDGQSLTKRRLVSLSNSTSPTSRRRLRTIWTACTPRSRLPLDWRGQNGASRERFWNVRTGHCSTFIGFRSANVSSREWCTLPFDLWTRTSTETQRIFRYIFRSNKNFTLQNLDENIIYALLYFSLIKFVSRSTNLLYCWKIFVLEENMLYWKCKQCHQDNNNRYPTFERPIELQISVCRGFMKTIKLVSGTKRRWYSLK